MLNTLITKTRLAALACSMFISICTLADAPKQINVPAGDLVVALELIAKQADVELVFQPEQLKGLQTRGVNGVLSLQEAVKKLLEGTQLQLRTDESTGAMMIGAAAASPTRATSNSAVRGEMMLAQAEPSTTGSQPQATNTSVTSDLKEIIVTAKRKFRPETSNAASKMEMPIIETPQALTVMSSEFLNIARLNDTASVVAYAPGVELRGIGDGTQPSLSARGFLINRERGFRINGLSTDSELDLDYFAMDRVEIVRGPASSLYGEADYGATFNRVLKSPSGKFGATASAEFGSYNLRRLQADVQGSLGSSGIVSARATAAVQDSETFIEATEDDRVLFSPSLLIDLDKTKILFQGYHQKLTGASSDGFPLISLGGGLYRLPGQSRSNNYGSELNNIDSENQFVISTVDHRINDSLNLTFKAGYSRIKMDNVSGYLFFAGSDGNSSLYGYPEDKTKEDLSFDVSLEKKLQIGQREQRLLLSADWRKNDYFQDIYTEPVLGTINIFDGGPLTNINPALYPQAVPGEYFSSQQHFSGVTALAHLKPAERLSLLLGMRFSEIETSVRDYSPVRYGFDRTISGLKDNAWVPRAAAVYKLADGHNAYLSYSEGIIFNQRFLRADGSPVNPETGVQYEVGVKGELFDRRLMYSASLFQITRTDVAAAVFLGPGQPSYYHNVGKQVHRGGELEVVGEPIPGLNVVANYSNLDVDVRESANPREVGQTPLASPAHSYSLFTTYELLHGPLRSLTFGGGVVARSKREVNSIGTFQLPSYSRVDLRASYNVSDALMIELNLQNVFNERIYTSVYGSPNFGVSYAYPRTAFGRVSYQW